MITHDVIIAIVAVELLFAFSVGIICIIFSFNLLRAVKEADGTEAMAMTHGDLSHSTRVTNFQAGSLTSSSRTDLEEVPLSPTLTDSNHLTRMATQGSEMDFEGPVDPNNPNPNAGLIGVYNSFISYIRLW